MSRLRRHARHAVFAGAELLSDSIRGAVGVCRGGVVGSAVVSREPLSSRRAGEDGEGEGECEEVTWTKFRLGRVHLVDCAGFGDAG